MRFLCLASSLVFATQATSLSILLPLYLWPDLDSPDSAWQSIFTAIESDKSTLWHVVINPQSGPGTTENHPAEDAYIDAVAKLNEHPNVLTIGYVPTAWGSDSKEGVLSQVDTYASWASYEAQNITISGIFFDEVIGKDAATDATKMQYYRDYSTRAHSGSTKYVVFNPGTYGPEALFAVCDTMVEFESPVSKWQGDTTIETFSNPAKTGVLLYKAAISTDVKGAVQLMKAKGVGSVFFDYGDCYNTDGTVTACYKNFNAAQLNLLAGAVSGGSTAGA